MNSQIKDMDSHSYDRAARGFALRDGPWRNGLADRLLSHARIRSSSRILDLGTGTGRVALRALPELGEEGRFVGIDHSEGMLAEAVTLSGNDTRLSFQVMDAERLQFEDGSFDSVVSQHALFHFPDPVKALKEATRVLKPGGYCVVGVGCGPPSLSWLWARESIKRVVELILMKCGLCVLPRQLYSRARDYLQTPPVELAATETVAKTPRWLLEIFRESGLEEVRWDWTGDVLKIHDTDLYWDVLTTFSSELREKIHHSPDIAVEELRLSFQDQCRTVLERGGRLLYPFASFYAIGRAPG